MVFDGVGGEIGHAAFEITAPGGRFSAHGTPGDGFAPIDPHDAQRRAITVRGIARVQLAPAEVVRLVGHALAVAAVNPRQVREFARATGKLAKTDLLDAQVLAHFAEAVRPPVRPLPDAAAQALGALVTRRRQLVEMLIAEENRHIEEHIACLRKRLRAVDKDLSQAVRGSPPDGAGPARAGCSVAAVASSIA